MTRISVISATRATIAITLLALLSACGHLPDPAVTGGAPFDPNEVSNRRNHEFNKALDSKLLRPVAEGYSAVVPDPIEKGINNFSTNLSLPRAIVNNALQGNGVGMTSDFYRFLVNTTLGIGGLFDVATDLNMPPRTDTDFGQTLYVWGVHEGPYVEIPVLGPSTSRAAVGWTVDLFTNPLEYVLSKTDLYYALGARGAKNLSWRARYGDAIDSVLYDSADSYAATRSLYLQNRRYQLGGGGSDTYLDPYDTPSESSGGPSVSADFEDPYDQ